MATSFIGEYRAIRGAGRLAYSSPRGREYTTLRLRKRQSAACDVRISGLLARTGLSFSLARTGWTGTPARLTPFRHIVADSKTVSLVLGSGGARGLAHIGAIQWLTENGYDIRSIAGSSMGALVGGIYAAGKLEVYAGWVSELERMQVLRLLDPAFGRSGLFKGERRMGVLRKLIGDFDIENLPISFTAVATDLESGEEVWLREGKLFDAIRASIATPLVFPPFCSCGRVLRGCGQVTPAAIA